jgi:hypothetical protein
MTVRLKPDEQRAVAKVLGENRNEILGRLRQGAGWQQMTDAQKAVAYIRVMDRIDEIRIKAFVDFVGPEQARARLLASRDVAGRLVERPAPLDFMDLTDTRREQRRQAAAAGG